jgi:hypothetical protein
VSLARAAAAACLTLAGTAALAQGQPDLRRALPVPPHAGATKCGACHTAESWGDVAFAHERTGFPLRGGHRRAGCKECHPGSFARPLSHQCDSCHRDPHRGQLGARCQGCHDEESWKSRFGADAHRRTGFPLNGRHAFIACEECHGDMLNRGRARPISTCYDCHQAAYARTGQTSLDHAASGLGTDCKECHSTWRFGGAFFPAHERCFAIASGPHAGIRCLSCHTSLASATATGACFTDTAACTRCHSCANMGPRHASVLGYQCVDRKCYECHRFSAQGAALKGTRRP